MRLWMGICIGAAVAGAEVVAFWLAFDVLICFAKQAGCVGTAKNISLPSAMNLLSTGCM